MGCEISAFKSIDTLKTQLKYVSIYIYVYMDPGLIFECRDIFVLAWTNSSLGKFFTHLTELLRNCHIFQSVKNYINADFSHPIRNRNSKT